MNSDTNLLTPNTLINCFQFLLMDALKTFVNDLYVLSGWNMSH